MSETFASILTREPDWTSLPAATPAAYSAPASPLPRERPHTKARRHGRRATGDRRGVERQITATHLCRCRRRGRANGLRGYVFSCWSASAAAAIVAWGKRPASVSVPTTRTLLSVAPTVESPGTNPLEQRVGSVRPIRTEVALSPDGKTLVLSAIWGGNQQLYSRAMDQFSATPMAGTSGASNPFFSPDGQWVGFWAAGELRKVPLGGGPAVTLCKAAWLFGASWGSDGTIVFATRPERRLVAGVGRGRDARGADDPSAGRVQSPLAAHAPRRPRRLFTISKARVSGTTRRSSCARSTPVRRPC